ncbi:FHA domain-containing protein [cf. Phormidesmis sp. LEGE 11477]|uniref:FHA domain-containing protein n=1 Tax=cf. Phormidesmis sp. LEGE 11477 TaxID=1828680 RepID=UPI001880755D|nr:FHA domain-containing protein [cf. Phormidesmis sp. LEGE 11477]MBE9063853.1 FHA domain-containing protein [cf. Phormidesmis sp. LEGE 11477]
MITCPNCNHQNPEGALQCEACYTPLPALTTCPQCQAPIQSDASFCGQCGNDLRSSAAEQTQGLSAPDTEANASGVSNLKTNGSATNSPEPVTAAANSSPDQPSSESFSEFSQSIDFDESVDFGDFESSTDPTVGPTTGPATESATEQTVGSVAELTTEPATESATESASKVPLSAIPTAPMPSMPATRIQPVGAALKHVQTETSIAVPSQLSVVRIGKPNEHTQPNIDISGFPNSEIVSRVHANLLVEGDVYYLEDMGSSNGTYINGLPLPPGNRYRLNAGDRIAFGKGDKVSFIFEAAGY